MSLCCIKIIDETNVDIDFHRAGKLVSSIFFAKGNKLWLLANELRASIYLGESQFQPHTTSQCTTQHHTADLWGEWLIVDSGNANDCFQMTLRNQKKYPTGAITCEF